MDFAHLWLIWKPVAQNLPWKNSSARWRHDDVIWPEWSFNARNAFTTGNWMNFRKILFASWSPSKKLGLPTSTTRSRSRLVAVHHSRYPKTQQSICFSNANRKTSRMVVKTNRLVYQPTGKSNFSAKKWYFYIFFDLTGWLMNQPVSLYDHSTCLSICIRKTYRLLGFGVSRAMNRD